MHLVFNETFFFFLLEICTLNKFEYIWVKSKSSLNNEQKKVT